MAFFIDYHLAAPVRLDIQCELRGFTALLGRSGAGKTSLLKALAGLLPATGTPWPGMPAAARKVGYMPQGGALFPHLSVLRNVAFGLRGADRLARARELLNELGIGDLAARGAETISGGEVRRVALARALARGPELLLLDEPTAGLDPPARDSVLSWLIERIVARKLPALAATHDFAVAGQADWVVILVDGKVAQQGKPCEVYGNPADIESAKLLGFANFWQFDGKIHTIRAEDIVLGTDGMDAVITAIRPQGTDLRLTCGTFSVLLRGADEPRYAVGQNVRLTFPMEKTRVLPE